MSRTFRLLTLATVATLSMGAAQQCNAFSETVSCVDSSYVVLPGACRQIGNPCGAGSDVAGDTFTEGWSPDDGFALDRPPRGISIESERDATNGSASFFICAAPDVVLADEPVGFEFAGRTSGGGVTVERGRGVATIRPRPVSIAASSLVSDPGDPIELAVSVDGGSPPYSYNWTPSDPSLEETTTDPFTSLVATRWTVRPVVPTDYILTVTDRRGGRSAAHVAINLTGLGVSADATPPTIHAGAISILRTELHNGVPPYTFAWTPSDSLLQITPSNWSALPLATTSYTVTVTDAIGETASASVLVTVVPAAPATLSADFTFVDLDSDGLHLDASASTGDIVQYAWDFSWTPPHPNIVTTSPQVTSFANTPGATGTITLTVTDRSGATSTKTRAFP